MRIGVFDSGLGGVIVLKELLNKHHNNEYIYYGDTKHLPYGEKSKAELFQLSKKIIEFFDTKDVDIIIIACGTVSTNIYESLKDITKTPVYNVIDPTIEYVNKKKHLNILSLATNATTKTHYFKNHLDSNVYEQACHELVPLIEHNKIEDAKIKIKEYLKPYISKRIDCVILGCTHYPILEEEVIKFFNNVEVINMGRVIASNIITKESSFSLELYFSKVTDSLLINIKNIIGNYRIIEKELE